MLYRYLIAFALLAVVTSFVIWHCGRLKNSIKRSLDEKERLRRFRQAGGTDIEFDTLIHREDDQFIEAQTKARKVGRFAE